MQRLTHVLLVASFLGLVVAGCNEPVKPQRDLDQQPNKTNALPDPEMGEGHDQHDALGPLVLQLAEIKLENGNVVTFTEVAYGSMLISEGGDASTQPVLDKYAEKADSPAHLARLLAPGAPVSAELEAASQRVLKANNWKMTTNVVERIEALDDALPLFQFSQSSSNSSSSSASSWCTGGSYAYNATFPGLGTLGNRASNVGGVLWFLSNGNENPHSRNDVLGVKGKVCVTDGRVRWRLSRRNCNSCNYYTIWDKTIDENHWYYAYNYDNHDDFKIRSIVEGKASSGSTFRHGMSTCHDYYVRVLNTSSLAAGCVISGPGNDYFIDAPYLGADPSNIYTSGYWN